MIAYGLSAIRFVPPMGYALVLLNTMLALKAPWPKQIKKMNLVLATIALIFSVKNIFWGYQTISGPREVGVGFDEKVVPYKSAEMIDKANIPGNVFNAHIFGSYLAWAWEGKRKIFYHGFVTDTDFYLREYIGFSRSKEKFDELVSKYNINVILVDRFVGEEALFNILATHPGWKHVYHDEGSVIFVRKL
jgi:hypothetical protein